MSVEGEWAEGLSSDIIVVGRVTAHEVRGGREKARRLAMATRDIVMCVWMMGVPYSKWLYMCTQMEGQQRAELGLSHFSS